MANKRDFYEVLGVNKSASAEEIKRSYRKLALEWHPDRNKTAGANDKFKEINEAYAVLSDTNKKSTYDQFGHAAFQPGMGSNQNQPGAGGPFGEGYNYYYSSSGGSPFGSGDYVDPFEIFEQFFGGGFSRRGRQPRHEVYQITIDFMDAVKGVTKEVHLPKGHAGDGTIKKTIKIPSGVDTGSRIRFTDFDIEVAVRQDKRFKREGDDLITEQEISFSQAVLGNIASIETIDGNVEIRIQPGTQPDTLIRLRGKGVSHVGSNGRGDHYVKIKIKIPTHLNRKQRELLEEFEENS